MIISFFLAQQAFAEVGAFESAQLDGTAHAPRQGDVFVKPLGDSSFGLTDRLAISANAVDWLNNQPNLSSEFNIVDNWDYALSITPYISTDYGLTEVSAGATLLHSLQYAEDRLNTKIRVGYVSPLDPEANLGVEMVSTGSIEGEVGLSYDIVASRSMVHRFKGSISSGMDVLNTISASAGYSFHVAIGDSARLELGVDVGAPSSVVGRVFNDHYREAAYGSDLADKVWMPAPNASLFWVF